VTILRAAFASAIYTLLLGLISIVSSIALLAMG
jgi:hypothetical protein